MSTIPKAYQAATLDCDSRSILAIAVTVWRQLPMAQRSLLERVEPGGWVVCGRKRDREKLVERGLAFGEAGIRITPLGALVREAGQASGKVGAR